MSFLNFSMLQVAALAALTIGAVLALFFLKLRHRRVVVGSALLWQRVLESQHSNSLIEKLRRLLSLLLALTIALLIALAIARPYLGTDDPTPGPTIVVLDTAASMAASTASGRTRWESAVAQAQRIVGESSSPAGMIVGDTAGRILSPLTDDMAAILSAIETMAPVSGSGRFPSLPIEDAAVYFITDGVNPPENVPEGAILVSVYEPADNVGISSFEIQVDPTSPSGYTAFMEVTNFSQTPKDVAIVVAGVGGQRVTRRVLLGGFDSWQEALNLDGFEGGGVQARIQAPNDGFALDDVAFSYLPARGQVEVMLLTEDPGGYLATLLRLTPEVDLTVRSPAMFEAAISTDVYVFDRWAPESPPGRPSLLFGAVDTEWLPELTGRETDLRISSWDEEHPVMRFVPVYDLRIDSAAVVSAIGVEVVAAAGETPLIVVDQGIGGPGDSVGPKAVMVTFALEDSDFPFHLGFPIFVENVLAWFAGETLAETSTLGEVDLPEATSNVTRLNGTNLQTMNRFGRTVVELREPDLLTAEAAGRRIRVAVNMTDPSGSNINQTMFGDDAPQLGILPVAGNDLWFYMVVAAMMLIALEWWTFNRRITL